MNRIQEAYCLNDEVYYSDHVSAILTIDGERVYLVKSYDDYIALKRQHAVTHRIGAIEPDAGLYRCDLVGSDGSSLTIHLTEEDIHHNILYVQSQMEINHVAMIC